MLQEAKQILRDAVIVLEDHKDVLPPHQYEQFKLQYRSYNWRITDESQENRAVKDALVKQSRILSQLYANRDSHQKRAYSLLCDVESYQTDVLAASRKGSSTVLEFPDEEFSPTSEPASSQSQTSSTSFTSWFSVFGRASEKPSCDLESGSSSPPSLANSAIGSSNMVVEGRGFIVAITHFPQNEGLSIDLGSGEVRGGDSVCRRMISFESATKRVDIIDPELHTLDPRKAVIAEDAIRAMTQLGERLMTDPSSKIPEGSQVTNNSPESASMEKFVKNFQQMSTGPISREPA